ncbi:hypothetical protein HYPSUDRAFT_138949 [Hypholoma sublateritium FD-334 SS-4]|uniref:Uncharacterized protein n=1 Tax=Hypholoma sublateritium (strain FD-334 SS-4) TaxID=945553 RepID=A0A0D2MGI7_HYPSF|nr:hypothetical protein HYPSUDRAFT_138949 [Hypholoma sublateritium FD-334 SS-4]
MHRKSPLATFFGRYDGFRYNRSESASSQFYRLCDFKKWPKYASQRMNAHADFKQALTNQFNLNYGTNVDDLGSWQSLCMHIGIKPIPDDLEECKKAVQRTHVNLVDLVDAFGTNRPIKVFRTERQLSEYTIKTGKYFPRDEIEAGDLLKFLLRHIFNPGRTD